MPRPARRLLPLLCATLLATSLAFAQTGADATPLTSAQVPLPADVAFPGTLAIHVDATDLARRIVRIREEIPASTGRLTLLYPQWLPGNHGPSGPLDKIAGLRITANGQPLAWTRDPLNVFAFHVDVPAGVTVVTAEYQYLTPTDPAQGRVVMTPNLLNLQWNALVLYPAGHYASRIDTAATVKYPAGFTAATALDVATATGDTTVYRNVPLDVLVDSPIYAGRYGKVIDLAPGAKVPVRLNVFADAPKYLEAKPEHIALHRKMVEQALKLYGAQHYDHYDFLFSLSNQLGGNGLEHQRSSENGEDPGYFTDYDAKVGFDDLLAHEYTHSWNGKFRRPADLWTPNYNVPMRDSLLWVYEGQTQYWGNVLTGRSGMRNLQASLDNLALTAATYAENRPGLAWRAVQDTTNDPIIASRRPKSYRNYQLAEDYYSAGQMIWLEADARIRAKTGGKRSLDDFARAFFGVDDGAWKTQRTYDFDEVVRTLDGVVKDDWATFLRDRLDGRTPLTGGLEAAGWRLVFKDEPNRVAKAAAKEGGADFVYSLGLSIGKDGKVADVRWDSPAFNAGIGTGMTLVAVNDREYSKDALTDAVKAAKAEAAPIRLMVKTFDRYQTIPVDYHGGLRYPHLERIPGKADLLSSIYAARR
ncbi:M61 family metallopeptidase [Lysobacter xanthus]